MTSQPASEIIHIVFTEEDVRGMVDDYNDNSDVDTPLDVDVAISRAHEWGKHIESTAVSLCAEQLESCITNGQP